MLGDADTGDPRWDGAEIAADGVRRIRLRVEALVLGEAAREENVDDRLCGMGDARGAKLPKLAHPETKQTDRARLESGAAGGSRVAERRRRGMSHCGLFEGESGGKSSITQTRAAFKSKEEFLVANQLTRRGDPAKVIAVHLHSPTRHTHARFQG